ncbi:unnamed protein product [Penicillium palitans]
MVDRVRLVKQACTRISKLYGRKRDQEADLVGLEELRKQIAERDKAEKARKAEEARKEEEAARKETPLGRTSAGTSKVRLGATARLEQGPSCYDMSMV